ADIADAAAIDAAPVRLDRLDDLHRRELRRAGDRAAGEAARQQIERILALGEPAFDRADEVVHAREALDVEKLRRADGARRAALAEIVAQQVDDHHVLRTVLAARG